MKIALVTDGVYPYVVGGMQRHSAYLTRYLVKRGVRLVLVHCVHAKELPTDEEVIQKLGVDNPENLEVITLRFPSFGKLPGHYLRESMFYSELALKALAPHLPALDAIYAKGLTGWMMADQRRKKKLSVPLAVKFHGYEMFQKIPGWKNRFARMLLRGPVKFTSQHADWVISYGGKITEIITGQLGIPQTKVFEIPTGIAEDWIVSQLPERGKIRRFVFVGRYERRKGVEELNQALLKLIDKGQFLFDFVGPVPYEKRIKHPNVSYHGQLTDTTALQSVFDSADVLVVPSHAEGMPNVILEGMARGLAVISTDVGAVSAMVDGEVGWLIAPHSTEALEQTLERALSINDDDLHELQRNALQRVSERFTWTSVADATVQAFTTIRSAHATE